MIKRLTQKEYDDYLTLDLIPELIDEYGEFDTIIRKNKKIHFAKTCKVCGDLIPIGKDYDMCKYLLDMETEVINQYLSMITGLEVVEHDDCLECECYDSETIDDDPDTDSDVYGSDEDLNEDTELDLDEDYGDGNYEE